MTDSLVIVKGEPFEATQEEQRLLGWLWDRQRDLSSPYIFTDQPKEIPHD